MTSDQEKIKEQKKTNWEVIGENSERILFTGSIMGILGKVVPTQFA